MYAMLTDSIRNKTKIYKNVLIFLKETFFEVTSNQTKQRFFFYIFR